MSELFLNTLEEEVFVKSSYFNNPTNHLKLIKELYDSIFTTKYKILILQNINYFLFAKNDLEHKTLSDLFYLEKELENMVISTVQKFNDLYYYYTINLYIIEVKIYKELYDFVPFEINNRMNEELNDSEKEKILMFSEMLTNIESLIMHIKVISSFILKKNMLNMISCLNGMSNFK